MVKRDPIVIEFHYTLAHSLLEIVKETLSNDSPLIGRLVVAIGNNARGKGEIACVKFSNDREGRKELEDFKKVSQLLEERVKEFFGYLA